jgi:hypothetical protein
MRKIRLGELIAAAGAVALLVITFLDWYAVRRVGLNAWEAFGFIDLLLAAVIVLALGLLASELIGRGPAFPVALAVITCVLVMAAVLLVAYRILNQPGPNEVVEVRAGAWLGLVAVVATFYGVWRSMSDERPRPVDPQAPEPERRATPAQP